MESTQAEWQKEKKNFFNEDKLNFCDKIKHNVCIIGSPKRRKGQKTYLKRVTENFPNQGKETVSHVQEAESLKQDEPKKLHTKIHNENIKN